MDKNRQHQTAGTSATTDANSTCPVRGKGNSAANVYGTVQRKGAGAGSDPAAVQSAAEHGVASGGSSIPHKSSMEAAFGMSFDNVTAHTGSSAASASRSIGADAYTSGNSIAFAAAPSKSLVAHELTHVVQQGAGAVPSGMVGTSGDSFEREADSVAATVASGGSTNVAQSYGMAGRPMAAVQSKAVQRFESGEHAILGAGPGYPQSGAKFTLPNGAEIFTGEMVAFGDFYSGMAQMSEAPRQEVEALAGACRFEAVWVQAKLAKRRLAGAASSAVTGQVAPGAPGGTAAPTAHGASTDGGNAAGATPAAAPLAGPVGGANSARLQNLDGNLTDSDPIWNDERAKLGGVTLRSLRDQIHAQFTPAWGFFGISIAATSKPATGMVWVRATVGRRRFRGDNDALARGPNSPNQTADPSGMGGDYLDLAQNNLSHFTTDNWANWQEMHKAACTAHRDATNDNAKQMALATDMMGGHYLTDRFSTGHFVDKEELMQYATTMMLNMARGIRSGDTDSPSAAAQAGETPQEQLDSLMNAAVATCFEDPTVGAKWNEGVTKAHREGVLTVGEAVVLSNLPASQIAPRLTGVIMGSPWRHYEAGAAPDTGADSRSLGSPNVAAGTASPDNGDYHLGVGNLAALQVHDAINRIGFTCTNKAGHQWRAQGDNQVNAETIGIAGQAIAASQAQVRTGTANVEAVKQFMPTAGFMDPTWLDDFFSGTHSTVTFDQSRVAALKGYVNGLRIPLEPSGNAVSPEMTRICHEVMDIMFVQPDAATALQPDGGTGLNLSMLKSFLIERLPDMVQFAYMSTSAADLPQAALEAYAPRDPDSRAILPRAANDFTWNGDNLSFNVNVTGCAAGTYTMRAWLYNQDAGYDIDARGQAYGRGNADQSGGNMSQIVGGLDAATNGEGAMGIATRNSDAQYGDLSFDVQTPAAPAPASPGAPPTAVVPATLTIPSQGFFSDGGDRYVTISGDPAGACIIGRSLTQDNGMVPGNQTPDMGEAPRVTGADAQTPESRVVLKGIKDDAFQWNENTVMFAVELENAPPTDTHATVYIKTMDWDIVGSDAQIGSPQARRISIMGTSTYSRRVLFTPAEDNWNDTYIIVYKDAGCSQELGRSRSQGHDRGTVTNMLGRKTATKVENMSWAGDFLTFNVEPRDSDPVYVRFFDKDWGYDYDESGALISGSRNTDPQVGGIRTVTVRNGVGRVASDGDSDTYGIVYSDPGCATPLKRSYEHG